MKRIYINNFAGLANRLETLVTARALQLAYGGEILLDWPELDALQVSFAQQGKRSLLDRWRARKVRNCSEEVFESLHKEKVIRLYGPFGPYSRIQPIYLETAAALHLRSDLASAVGKTFAKSKHRPVVGVHLRRGDFASDATTYDTVRASHPAVPTAWIESTLHHCLKIWPDCTFFVAASGADSVCSELRKNFDVFQVPHDNPYELLNPGHAASAHPVADLFALACCQVLVATPLSSYSHFAANALGPHTTCIVPPQRLTTDDTRICQVDFRGKPLEAWDGCFRNPAQLPPLPAPMGQRLLPRASWDWIPVFNPNPISSV